MRRDVSEQRISRAVANGGPVVPGPPIWNRCPPISRLAPRLLHTSNTVSLKYGPHSGVCPPLLLNPDDGPAHKPTAVVLHHCFKCRMRLQAPFVRPSGFLPEFPQTCSKSFCVTFVYKFFRTKIMETIFWVLRPKRSLCVFLQTLGAFFEVAFGRHFCSDFQEFCLDFQGFCPDFWQITTCGGALAPPPHTPLVLQ